MEKRHKSKLLELIFTSYFFSCEYVYLEEGFWNAVCLLRIKFRAKVSFACWDFPTNQWCEPWKKWIWLVELKIFKKFTRKTTLEVGSN